MSLFKSDISRNISAKQTRAEVVDHSHLDTMKIKYFIWHKHRMT